VNAVAIASGLGDANKIIDKHICGGQGGFAVGGRRRGPMEFDVEGWRHVCAWCVSKEIEAVVMSEWDVAGQGGVCKKVTCRFSDHGELWWQFHPAHW